MLATFRKWLARRISPSERVEIRQNWQATAEERLGDHTDKPYDHYAQFYATVDGEHCGIGFDVYVADVEGRAEARLNVWERTERWQMHTREENPKPRVRLNND